MIGLDAELVEVEADARGGLSRFYIVGLPDAMVQEARERVKSAVKHSGFRFPSGTVVVNLAPADVRKFGTLYDLPIAVSIALLKVFDHHETVRDTLLAGELALDGGIRPISGALSLAALARERGLSSIIVPKANADEAALIPDVTVYGAETLESVISHLLGSRLLTPTPHRPPTPDTDAGSYRDFRMVRGQESAKRALEVAAAGGHNVLMQGPPGSGKTLLASCYPSILPPLEPSEILEVTRIWSVAGMLDSDGAMNKRPFRSPHHTASGVSLVGGGTVPRPGEISLAHRGVLFMDEFPEFPRPVLENLRQPLEDGTVSVTRVQQSVTYPARFNLIAAMNPCPCGYATDPDRDCVCTPNQIISYAKRLSGPLLDRIDLLLEVPKVPLEDLTDCTDGEASSTIRGRVIRARTRQLARRNETGALTNAELSSDAIRRITTLEEGARKLLEHAVDRYKLSARAYFRTLKVALTVADLAGVDRIASEHVAEAVQYRQLHD